VAAVGTHASTQYLLSREESPAKKMTDGAAGRRQTFPSLSKTDQKNSGGKYLNDTRTQKRRPL